jgi:alginate O-acetyltransferase complex protein AlgJ
MDVDKRLARIDTFSQWVLAALLVTATTLPMLGILTGWGRNDTGWIENRPLKTFPRLALARREVKNFRKDFEAWFNDNFGWRTSLVRFHGHLAIWLGVSPTPKVVLGKQGWLYYDGEPGQNFIDIYYRSVKPFTVSELETWQTALEERQRWLAKHGISYLVVFIPNKETIYPEFLPDAVKKLRETTRLDQLVDYLRCNSTLDVLDLREALLVGKKRAQIYFRTDTHWNSLGAYIAYEQIINCLARRFPSLRVVPLNSLHPSPSFQKTGGDLASMLGFVEELPEGMTIKFDLTGKSRKVNLPPEDPEVPLEQQPFAMESQDPWLPRAVMFRDSFAEPLVPLLSEHFARIAYVWSHEIKTDLILKEKPNVVIEEFVERLISKPSWNKEALR